MKLTFLVVFLQSPIGISWVKLSSDILASLVLDGVFSGIGIVLVLASLLPGWVGAGLGEFSAENNFTSWVKLAHFLGVFLGVLKFFGGGFWSNFKIPRLISALGVGWGFMGFGGFLMGFLVLEARPLCLSNINVVPTFTNSCCLYF